MNEPVYEKHRDKTPEPFIAVTIGADPHYHTHIELICVVRGKIEVRINDEVRILTEGSVAVAGSLDVHAYKNLTDDAEGWVLIAPTKSMGRFEIFTGGRILKDHFFGGEGYGDIRTLIEIGTRYMGSNELALNGVIDAVLGIAAQNLSFCDSESAPMEKDVMREVLLFISENRTEDITLGGLAKRFGYSPNHFSKLFNAHFNVGLKEYLNSVRADRAAELIMSGADVNRAAFDSGFDCMRTFYRAFRSRFGQTPQEYVRGRKRGAEKS